MSIQYSGNAQTAIYSTGSSTPATDMETNLLTILQAAGWTKTPINASDVLTFTAQPAASSSFTLDSAPNAETYTFVSSSPTGNQILIDSSLANTIQNIVNALNTGTGSGTKYGSTLAPPPNMTASGSSGTTLTVSYKTSGSAGNGAPATTTGTINATWATSSLQGGGNILLSAITPQGLQCRILMYTTSGSFYNPGTAIVMVPGTRGGERVASTGLMINAAPPTNTNYRVIASKYQFFQLVPGTVASNTIGNGIGVGVPYITSNLVAPTIVSASNANPIVCNIPSHGFGNGQQVLIVGGLGNTNVNGIFTITVIDGNNFSLNSSSGNGTYIANSAYCSNLTLGNTINEAIWASASSLGEPNNFRNQAFIGNGWQTVNANSLDGNQSIAVPQWVTSGTPNINSYTATIQWYDNTFLISEPFLAWGISNNATPKIIGQMWDAILIRDALTIDQTATFDSPSHNWWTYGSSNQLSFMLAIS